MIFLYKSIKKEVCAWKILNNAAQFFSFYFPRNKTQKHKGGKERKVERLQVTWLQKTD